MQKVRPTTLGSSKTKTTIGFPYRPSGFGPGPKKNWPIIFIVMIVLGGLVWWAIDNFRAIDQIGSENADQNVDALVESPDELPEYPFVSRVSDRIRHGESLSAALARHDISNQESFQLAEALRKELNLRSIRPGDVFVLERQIEPQKRVIANETAPEKAAAKLYAFELVRSDGFGVPVRYRAVRAAAEVSETHYNVTRIDTPVTKRVAALGGRISSSLYDGIIYAGGDPALVNRFSDVFAWQLDFYREAQKGDAFKMIVEARFAEGRFVGYGRVLAAEYNNAGRQYRGFYFESEDGEFSGVFDEQGNSLEKSFLRSPMELARITSRYGQRFHPILRRQRKHNGVDYGAPPGTPFWSIADGVVLEARYSPTAGKMIRIRHRAGYTTEYFHSLRFAAGIRAGAQVKQRQVIGYVGTTGRSTGPHLHFGMMLDKRYVDPSKQNFPAGKPVPPKLVKSYLNKVKPLLEDLSKIEIS